MPPKIAEPDASVFGAILDARLTELSDPEEANRLLGERLATLPLEHLPRVTVDPAIVPLPWSDRQTAFLYLPGRGVESPTVNDYRRVLALVRRAIAELQTQIELEERLLLSEPSGFSQRRQRLSAEIERFYSYEQALTASYEKAQNAELRRRSGMVGVKPHGFPSAAPNGVPLPPQDPHVGSATKGSSVEPTPMSHSGSKTGALPPRPRVFWWVGLGVGVGLLLILLVIAVAVPCPTSFQFTVFRATLAASISSIATSLGWSTIGSPDDNGTLAGPVSGGLALFLLVYLINPARRLDSAKETPPLITASSSELSPVIANSIFICYRRANSVHYSGRIRDGLVDRFGRGGVFKDYDDIQLGTDYRAVLNQAVSTCRVMVAVIGPGWESVADPKTQEPRLHSPNDYVRIEIATALARNIHVIPVLIEGASMPPQETLPDDIKNIVYRQHIEIRNDPDFRQDLDRLAEGVSEILAGRLALT